MNLNDLATSDDVGPIDYVIVEFADAASSVEGFDQLLRLVDNSSIRVLDLEFIDHAAGHVDHPTEIASALAQFEGADSGLLDDDDVQLVRETMTPGSLAAVLIYEDTSMLGVLKTWRERGATVHAQGPLLPDDVLEALDALDAGTAAQPERQDHVR